MSNNGNYIGNSPVAGPSKVVRGSGTGDNTTTVFPMGFNVGSDQDVYVFIDGVKQDISAYTVSGSNCTFVTAPLAGENIEFIGHEISTTNIPQDGSVTLNKTSGSLITSSTAIATTSGTEHDFTSIPSWVKKITVMIDGVSTDGLTDIVIQIGTSTGIENTGYLSANVSFGASANATGNYTTGFGMDTNASAANTLHGSFVLTKLDGNTWTMNGGVAYSNTTSAIVVFGSKTLSGVLDRVRLTTANGTDTFDAGKINILYE